MILVTGAFGFIGSHLVESIAKSGSEVVAVGHPSLGDHYLDELLKGEYATRIHPVLADLKSFDAAASIFQRFRPRVVYHLAAIASHRLSFNEPYLYLDNNLRTTLNVIEAARISRVSPRILFASSSSVYGENRSPLTEDLQPRPKGPYAVSKWLCEELAKAYHRDYSLDVVIVRYFNVVGERCRSNIVFRVFADKISSGREVEVNGRVVEGVFRPAARDFTYVEDVVRGTILAAEKGRSGEVYNLGRGVPVSVLDVAYEMMRLFGRNVEIIQRELSPHESLEVYSDSSKARRELGWAPQVGFEEMVKRFIEWYKATYHHPPQDL